MDFLVELMEHFGLLVAVPGSDPQQWMLPMRLPERNVVLATATARGAFASFLVRMELAAHADAEVATLASAIEPIADAQIVPRDALRNGCEIAYRKADAVLAGRTRDGNGLNREQIAAINYYTQEFMSPTDPYAKVNVYYPMNVALRSQEIERVRPFWAYIELLQPALLQLPPSAVPAGLFRGLNGPQPPIDDLATLRQGQRRPLPGQDPPVGSRTHRPAGKQPDFLLWNLPAPRRRGTLPRDVGDAATVAP